MALFSDVDWLIIVAVALFLLFGRDGARTVRTFGRWYARAGRLKQELLTEMSRAADLPLPPPGAPLSVRGALLGLDSHLPVRSGIPAAVRTPPAAPPSSLAPPLTPWTGGAPTPTWTMTVPTGPLEPEGAP